MQAAPLVAPLLWIINQRYFLTVPSPSSLTLGPLCPVAQCVNIRVFKFCHRWTSIYTILEESTQHLNIIVLSHFHNLLKDKNINEGLNELSTWNRDACLQSIFANQTAHQWRFCGQASQLQGERLCWKTVYKTILIETESMKVQEDAFSAYCEYWWTMNINDESGEHW